MFERLKRMLRRDKESGALTFPSIEFLCEQDGSSKNEVKQGWVNYFRSELSVSRAYLLRARYGDSQETHVALCIRIDDQRSQQTIIEHSTLIFQSIFSSAQSLDIIFLRPTQEEQVVKVARPFYAQAPFKT